MDDHQTSQRDPRHVIEDAIEENGDESIAHAEYYEGADDFPCNSQEKSLVVVAQELITPPTKYHTMPVVPGRIVRGILDVSSFLLCIACIVVQFGLIDYYYLSVLADKVWFSWIGADALVLVLMLWLLVLAVRRNQTHMDELGSIDSTVNYAWIAWLAYSLVLAAKVATCFQLFYQELPPSPLDNNDKLFDDHLFKLGLTLSIPIFVFLLEAHHYTPVASHRQLYISYISACIAFDLVDNVLFLDLLWDASKHVWSLPLWLDITILALACINFVMPTFVLFKLRFEKTRKLAFWSGSFLYNLFVNGPFLGLRIYLYVYLEIERSGKTYNLSVMGLKNVLFIYLALRETWGFLQLWRTKRQNLQAGEHLVNVDSQQC